MIDTPQAARSVSQCGGWARFRGNVAGVTGFAGVFMLVLVSVLGPALANRQPIACLYQGELYFPAAVDVLRNLPLGSRWVQKPKPFRFPTFDAKRDLSSYDFALWPPIPFGPRETSDDILAGPSAEHWLGTDEVGRDVAARLVHGTSVSVGVGLSAMALATLIGVVLGGLAGYAGGVTDMLISRLIEVVMCFPVFFLILSVMVWVGPDTGAVGVAAVIGLTRWTSIARYTRGEFLRLKSEQYVAAARALGAGRCRIIFRHILPHASAPVLVAVTFGLADVVLIESGLSWLGFGIQAPEPSWGNVLRAGYDHMTQAPHLIYCSCAAIFLAVLAYNLTGERLRTALNPGTLRR